MAQEPTYDVTSTPAAAAWEAGGTPQHTKARTQGIDMGDEGMVGAHKAGRMTLANAHPYQSHSVGYEDSPSGTQYVNHGIDAVHIKHGRRDKNPEHHPPLGLMDYEPTEHNSKLQASSRTVETPDQEIFMGKAYTPTIASSNTSSPVRNMSMSLNGQSPLSTFGSGHSPSNMHTNTGPQAFNTPTHGATLLGGANGAHIQNKETRANGVPHMSWMP